MKRKILTAMATLLVAASLVTAEYEHHSTVTYIIVPFKDVTEEMLGLVAQDPTMDIRHTVSGADHVLLEFVLYKKPADPMPVLTPNDKPMSAEALHYNDEKLSKYPYAHKTTPVLLQPYKQFSNAEILAEMKKPEWTVK